MVTSEITGWAKLHSSALQVCNAVRLVWMSKSFTAVTTNTRPRMFFFLSGWNLSFRGRQSTVSMVFSRALTEKVPSSLNEGRRQSTRIISHDDGVFNFIYLIKMKDYMVKTTRSLPAEWNRRNTLYTVNSLYSGHYRDLKLVSSVARVRNSGSLFQSNVCNLFLPGIYLLSVLSGCPL